jgi:hypothetical protein
MSDEPSNRVWIELERPDLNEDRQRIGDERAALLTNLLKRLAAPDDVASSPVCRYREHDHKGRFVGVYELVYGPMRVETLNDHGSWFNLDYFGREGA